MKWPAPGPVRAANDKLAGMLGGHRISYGQCRLDLEFDEYIYRSCLLAAGASIAAFLFVCLMHLATGAPADLFSLAEAAGAASLLAAIVFAARLYWITSLRNYRGALIDANAVHAVALMLAMTGYDVPLQRIFVNLSNLGSVYGEDVALEAAYMLALVEEDGLGVLAALRQAAATAPSALWKELLAGIAAVYSSGGDLRLYLQGRYDWLAEKKALDVRKYNEIVQGASSVYLSVIGIGAILAAIVNMVFAMAGFLGGDALVWIDALAIVPLGSLVIARALWAACPEASPP